MFHTRHTHTHTRPHPLDMISRGVHNDVNCLGLVVLYVQYIHHQTATGGTTGVRYIVARLRLYIRHTTLHTDAPVRQCVVRRRASVCGSAAKRRGGWKEEYTMCTYTHARVADTWVVYIPRAWAPHAIPQSRVYLGYNRTYVHTYNKRTTAASIRPPHGSVRTRARTCARTCTYARTRTRVRTRMDMQELHAARCPRCGAIMWDGAP